MIILIIISLIIYQSFFKTWKPLLPKKLNQSSFFYYGHRGAPLLAPENTLLSFHHAIDNQLDGIELDIQLTKDDYLIVYHDEYIHYNNSKVKINSLTLQQINTIDVKNDFDELTFQKIPTLEEVFSILPENIILNIEIKSYGQNYFNAQLVKILLDMINRYSINNQIIISSFNPFIIKYIKKLNKTISTALIWNSKSYYNYKILLRYSKPDAFHVNIKDIDAKMINWLNAKNINVYTYTVNFVEELAKAKQYNLNGIFTDNPKIKNNVLNQF